MCLYGGRYGCGREDWRTGSGGASVPLCGEILQEKRMDEAVASSDSLEQNTLSRLFQKTDVVPGECPASPEDPPEEIVLQVCCSTEVQPAEQPACQHTGQPTDQHQDQHPEQPAADQP